MGVGAAAGEVNLGGAGGQEQKANNLVKLKVWLKTDFCSMPFEQGAIINNYRMENDKLGSAFVEAMVGAGPRLSVAQGCRAVLKAACKRNEMVQGCAFSIAVSCLIRLELRCPQVCKVPRLGNTKYLLQEAPGGCAVPEQAPYVLPARL